MNTARLGELCSRVERTIEPSGRWFDELCLWLRCPIRALGSIGWPIVLSPGVIDSGDRLGGSAEQLYHRLKWHEAPPSNDFTVAAQVGWVTPTTDSVEVGMGTSASVDGRQLAQSLLVTRMAGHIHGYGRRPLLPAPPQPDLSQFVRRRTLAIDAFWVRLFADMAALRNPVHDDERAAWAAGYPAILVPDLMLFVLQLCYADLGPAGEAEMWFSRGVPAGSLIECCQSPSDADLWIMRLVGSGEIATIARLHSGRRTPRRADDGNQP